MLNNAQLKAAFVLMSIWWYDAYNYKMIFKRYIYHTKRTSFSLARKYRTKIPTHIVLCINNVVSLVVSVACAQFNSSTSHKDVWRLFSSSLRCSSYSCVILFQWAFSMFIIYNLVLFFCVYTLDWYDWLCVLLCNRSEVNKTFYQAYTHSQFAHQPQIMISILLWFLKFV